MFYYLNGTVALLEAGMAVIDCGGIGFAVNTSTYTQSQLKQGQVCRVYTHCNIREDAFDIYGFSSKEELNCFQKMLGVSGVGPKAALAILSAVTPQNLTLAILTGDEKALTAAPGVGKKLAQRIILELKDKMGGAELDFSGGADAASPVPINGGAIAEASAALAVLGYSQSEIGVALRGVDTTLPTEEIVRRALRNLVTL
jgi:Holliday junction DNA helicase RuvA